MKENTSWGSVSKWYDEYMGQEDNYQSKVILPNLLRVLNPQKDEKILDLACGQGFFSGKISALGAEVTGVDIAKELIDKAREHAPKAKFHVSSATDLSFLSDGYFDSAICVLAIQNIDDITTVFMEIKRVLKPGGRFLIILNHPTFRVLKRSSWEWDEERKIQYRRIDGYLSASKIEVEMNPGSYNPKKTISFHRSLQDFFKPLNKAGLAVTRLEEWISHKSSEKGPRQAAEDTARKEIPIFMVLEVKPITR